MDITSILDFSTHPGTSPDNILHSKSESTDILKLCDTFGSRSKCNF
jgi:hypothetical protein